MNSFISFPKDFVWGAATASYQIEGAIDEGGRGVSVWDTFSNRPGKVLNNDSGERACDHYNRWKEDVALMKEMGLQSYRFSIAWPRIFPEGEGRINQEGVDFYNKLIDALLEAGITPAVTLFHWDLPQALEDKYGGWRSKEVSRLFGEYAAFCGETFGDRVKTWYTINEITCFTILAHDLDWHAPGKKEDRATTNQTIHNALLGHGLAMKALRECGHSDIKVGLVENLSTPWPIYNTEENIKAARQCFYDSNQYVLFPALTGKYDEEAYKKQRGPLPEYSQEEMQIIGAPMDFIGYNIYFGSCVKASPEGYQTIDIPKNFPRTDMGWGVSPKAIYWAIMNTSHFFGDLPVYIVENGMACEDKEEQNGEVLDIDRVEYLRAHIEMCGRAIQDGGNLKGYYAWSLMDNFEWAFGYTKRFGLVRVNYRTMERTVKLSGKFYSDVISNNGL